MDDYLYQQCSGVPPEADQQTKSSRYVGVAHEMDFLLPVTAFRCSQINIRDSGFDIYRHLTPETMKKFDLP